MKTGIKNPIAHSVLMAALGLIPAGRVTAQTFTTLYSFSAPDPDPNISTNNDGAYPSGGLILLGNKLYGTAESGGSSGAGTVFAVNTDGTGFTNLYTFSATGIASSGSRTNMDGYAPNANLTVSSNTLFGTALRGGDWGFGTVFALNTNGTGFTNLHSFTATAQPYYTNSDGANPYACLVSSGNTLYGTAGTGGSSGAGTVFKVDTDGTGFSNIHNFTGGSEGALPYAGLLLTNNTLYGTTIYGGSSGNGTVFGVKTDGTGFTNLHSFTAGSGSYPSTNSDGARPWARLTLSGNTLYGTAELGGSSGRGTVFAVNTDGTGFTNLHSFSFAGSDGASPEAGLILSGSTLYGTAVDGGSSVAGTVFGINTDGTGFTTLHNFTPSDGDSPAELILSGRTLYGTTKNGGSHRAGTAFSLSFSPRLTITLSGTNVALSWPTNYAGFDYTGYTLQSATNLVSPVWTTNSPAPVVVNGQNTVTNPISGAQEFYRLIQ